MHMRSVCLFLVAGAVFAQTDARPAFEAAFIKANNTGSGSSSSNGTKGQIVIVNQSLKRIIERAFNVKSFQVTGPDWIENERFDITAKYPEGTKNSDRPAMLRSLLEDRFKLTTHTETKDMPGYALVVAKSGLKVKPLTESTGNDGTSSNDNNGVVTLKVTNIAMSGFADYLARRLDAIVVDRTDAAGHYTFELHWTVENQNGGAERGAAEFGALQEVIGSLGLRLQATKVPVEIVVVDHAERVPTEN